MSSNQTPDAQTTDTTAETERTLISLVREHPAAFIAGGVVLGLVAGALLPRRAGGTLTKRAFALAAAAGEMGLAASLQARESAGKLANDARDLVDRDAAIVKEKTFLLANSAKDAGEKAVRRAAGIASRLKR